MILQKNKKYLQIALNGSIFEAKTIISKLPLSDRILIEAGTPFIKSYGKEGIKNLKRWCIEKSLRPKQNDDEKQNINLSSLIKIVIEKNRDKNMPSSFLKKQQIPFLFNPWHYPI